LLLDRMPMRFTSRQIVGVLALAAMAGPLAHAEPPGSAPRGAPGWNASHSRSAARAGVERVRDHGARMNLEAGIALRHQRRDLQRGPEIERLQKNGSRDDLERFRSRILAEDAIDRRTTVQEVDALQRRRLRREVDELERILGNRNLGALSRGLITQRRAELLEREQAWRSDETLRALEREVSQSETPPAPSLAGPGRGP